MKLRFSISLKLLLIILPLVCVPIAMVGYLSTKASADRVNRLVRHEEMIEVKTVANKINDVFYYCRLDLKTISSLPVLEDYHIARSFKLQAETEFIYENIIQLFKDFIMRAPYYHQIRYLDKQGQELVCVQKEGAVLSRQNQSGEAYFQGAAALKSDGIFISDVLHSPSWDGYVIYWAKPVYSSWKELSGVLVIDLDYGKIIDIVKQIRVGEQGYAFLIDHKGRLVAHPLFEPYTYTLDNYPTQTLRGLVHEMMSGRSEWGEYLFQDEKKMAAFAPIPNVGWSLAATIPSDELKREASAIQARVVQIVLVALALAVLGVSVLSYYLLRPVRNLVEATNRIAMGDLRQEIPIQSRDELGDLTRSFNRMVRNLSKTQNELVRSEKLISLGRLSAGVAHEIRNPLNAIKGAIVHLKRRRSEDPLIGEYAQLISEEIDRLNRFVTEFLYFAKQSTPQRVASDINHIILSTQSLFSKQAQERRIVFRNQLDPFLPKTYVDPQQIGQVLVNLLLNAMDAMPDGGSVTFSSGVDTSREDPEGSSMVQIHIRDNGVGIPKEHLQNVFDPFFSTKETGTGLGLPLSLGIVEAHGGTIRILSQGEGTRATVELPLALPPAKEPKEKEDEKSIGGG
jgi:two-component system NtrC family sensor kinase